MDQHETIKQPVTIEIDSKSGFCFGVSRAVKMAEEQLALNQTIFSLGDIVHNSEEVARLEKLGMASANHDQIPALSNKTILFRAHGEPPATYDKLKQQGACIVDATCPVVLKLQQRVKSAWMEMQQIKGQVVIYGKKGHPEVTGLVGQTNGEAIVISTEEDLTQIDPDRPLVLFAQTTMSYPGFEAIQKAIRSHCRNHANISIHNTICSQVGKRAPHLKRFAARFDVVVFVGGEKSSNAKVLFEACRDANATTYFAQSAKQVQREWFSEPVNAIGICGATSTPLWLMEEVAQTIHQIIDTMSGQE